MIFDKQRLQDTNLKKYIYNRYKSSNPVEVKSKQIQGIYPLLQNDYGDANDCTLTSILTILNYLKGNVSLNAQYVEIEKIAKKFFYNGDFGTLPFFTRSIMKKAYSARIAKAAYLKCVGFNQHTIMNLIDKNIPVILSVFNDGRSFYVSHSITIVGYKTFNINGKILCFFMVYDNWVKTISYVDYEVLSPVSSINYYK